MNITCDLSSDKIQNEISMLYGEICCRKRVGSFKSLSVGFGEKKYHGNNRLPDAFYGEWEIGTYTAAWRVVKNERVLCGSHELVDDLEELNEILSSIQIGRIISLRNLSNFDIRVEFDCGTHIDFLNVSSDDDELFHVFGPDDLCVVFLPIEGWRVGKSNEPWH